MEYRETGEFAHRETTTIRHKETFNNEVCNYLLKQIIEIKSKLINLIFPYIF